MSQTWEGTFEVLGETSKAILLWDGERRASSAKWIPKSQVTNITEIPSTGMVRVEMTEWIADKMKFI